MTFSARGHVTLRLDVPPEIIEEGILRNSGKLVIRMLERTDPGYKVRREGMGPLIDVLHRYGWGDYHRDNVSVIVYLNGQPTKLAEIGTTAVVFKPLSVVEHIGTLEGA